MHSPESSLSVSISEVTIIVPELMVPDHDPPLEAVTLEIAIFVKPKGISIATECICFSLAAMAVSVII